LIYLAVVVTLRDVDIFKSILVVLQFLYTLTPKRMQVIQAGRKGLSLQMNIRDMHFAMPSKYDKFELKWKWRGLLANFEEGRLLYQVDTRQEIVSREVL